MQGANNRFSQGEDVWTIIRYDLTQKNTNQPQFHGIVPFKDIASHYQLIETVFDIADPADVLKDPWPTSIWDTEDNKFVTQVVPYDIEGRLAQYAAEFHRFLVEGLDEFFQREFSRITDFNQKYRLTPDPILEASSFLQIDSLTAMFVKMSDGTPLTIEERQTNVAPVRLIPQVPESVVRTFQIAKRLYVFAHFEYGFFTVADHYAYLALEAAVHSRWVMTLPKPAKLSFGNSVGIQTPSYWGIYRQVRSNPGRPMVNGEPFPRSTVEVLQALQKKQIITKWELSRLQIGMYLRNSLSHLEFAPVHSPSPGTLSWVAALINRMFDSVPQTPAVSGTK